MYLRLLNDFDAEAALQIGPSSIRRFSTQESDWLASELRRGNPFIRVYGAYASAAPAFAGRTVLECRNGTTEAVSTRSIADRVLRLAFAATTLWIDRARLHQRFSIAAVPAEATDLFIGPGLRVSARMQRVSAPRPMVIDRPFVARFRRYGFARLASQLVQPQGFAFDKVDRALVWLTESRLDRHSDAALVKIAIGLEALFVSQGEPKSATISTRLGSLLGRTAEQRETLTRYTARLYEARNAVVHEGRGPARISPAVLDVAGKLLVLSALGFAFHSTVLSDRQATKRWFQALLPSARPPPLPFGNHVVGRLVARTRSGEGRR